MKYRLLCLVFVVVLSFLTSLPPGGLEAGAEDQDDGRLYGDVYDPAASSYEDFARPPFYPSDLYSTNHPDALPDTAPPPSRPGPPVIAHRTIDRKPDQILVHGALVPGAKDLAHDLLRLMAYKGDEMAAIPFQIDERDEDGWYLLDAGPSPSPRGSGRWKDSDELVFRARDVGDRVGAQAWPTVASRVFEIEVSDPLTDKAGWVYLVSFEGKAPPLSKTDYVDLVDHGEDGHAIAARYYTVKYPARSLMWYGVLGTRAAGYDEIDFLDRGYLRFELKLFGFIPINLDLEHMEGSIPCWKDGPVRVIRRVEVTKVRIGWVKVPFDLRYDILFYDQLSSVPMKIEAGVTPRYVASKAVSAYGTDLNPNAKGMRWYCLYEQEGVEITGKPDDDPAKARLSGLTIPPEDDDKYFHLVTGKHGTLLRRHVSADPEIRKTIVTKVSLLDNEAQPDPPEFYPGRVGCTENEIDLLNLPGGTYYAVSEWYYCENFRYPDDVPAYLNIVNEPCRIVVRAEGAEIIGEGSASPLEAMMRYRH